MNASVKVGSVGPEQARILIIGEAPGKDEVEEHTPFVGGSGRELTKMLNEAGILRTECRITNVCKYRPPGNKMDLWWPEKKSGKQVKKFITSSMQQYEGDYFDPRVIEGLRELNDEILRCRPSVIVPLGNLPLWATTRNSGITKWRGSLLHLASGCGGRELPNAKVIPTFHPANILRTWENRWPAVHDLRRAKRWKDVEHFPEITENFRVKPDFDTARGTLQFLLSRVQQGPTLLAVDIETSRRHLACIGIAWSRTDAICLPLFSSSRQGNYWTQQEELVLILLLRELLTHPNAQCIGQNWQYDYQYIAKYLGFEVNLFLDIMSEHHVQFPGLPKGLDFQSSLYCDIHVYWKDEGKEMGKGDEVQWWIYNCKDCVRTFEIAEVLLQARKTSTLKVTNYGSPFEIQQRLSVPISRASMRGVRLDHGLRTRTAFMLQEDIASAEGWLNRILKRPFNCNSPPQMSALFYGELQQAKILHRKTHKPTLDGDALEIISKRDVLLRPLCQGIQHIRTLKQSLSVCLTKLDGDGRFRCQFTIPGTETYRFASSTDPFGFGTNGQNISSGDRSDKDFPPPNLRKLFIPDENRVLCDFDMPQADARVVAWEANDEKLIALLLDPTRHLHMENAEVCFGTRPKSKSDRNYYYAKQGVHLTNYGGTPPVLAKTLGITIQEAERFQNRWFGEHKPIKDWHQRVLSQLQATRYVTNAFGYRRFYFDRIETLLKEALAWIPQSTVAIATNLGILQVMEDEELVKEKVELLLQVHDSSLFQWPVWRNNIILPKVMKKLTVTVPYERPLVFNPGLKMSTKSWGDCEEVKLAA